MISENIRTNSTMDWNMSSSDSSLQAKKFEFQGLPLEQQFSAKHGFSQDHAPTQNLCVYPGNNQTVNSPSNPMTAKKLPLHNTGTTSIALQPIHPSSKRRIAAKGLTPSLSLVQMTPAVIQNSVVVGTVLHGSTGNPVQSITQKRMNPYTTMGNYNNQSPQICSNSVRTSGYRQVCKNNLSPKNPASVHYYVNGTVSQMGAAVPLNSSPSPYLHSQQNFSCVILPVGQNNPKQINGQNSNMTGTVQSQQYASDHINPAPYNVSTYNHNRNATQIPPCNVPNQVTNKNLQAPPPYSAQPIQTNYGQFPLLQTVATMSAENLQNYHNPIPNLNGTSYSTYYNQKGQISRETNTVGSTAYNISEQGSENQLSNEPTKSSVDFWENPLNNVQAARTGCADGALTPQTSQTSEPPKNLNNLENFSITSSNNKRKITKESLAVDYKKLLKIEYALLMLGKNYQRKCKMFLSAEQNEQAAAHNQNLNQSSGNVTQNQPSHVVNPALQFSSLDATQNQSFSPASCDSNQIKDIPLLLKKTDSHLLPVLRSLLEGTADEHMILSSYFVKDSTDQNKQLAIDGSSSGSSGKSEYNIKNPVSTPSPRAQLSQMNPTQEPLPHMKNNHAFNNFKINKDAIEALRHIFNHKLPNLVQSSATSCESSSSVNKAVKENSEISHQMPSICSTLMQKSVKNINIESEHVSDASSSVVQKENHTTSADSFRNGGVCSLEELEATLALWKKSLPESLNGQSCESTQSSVGLSSTEGGKDYKMIQNLQNLTNEFIQNDQTQVTFESNGTAQTSVPISRKTHEDVSSNLLKGAEPQVAIVTPLMMSKDYVQITVQNNSPVSQNLKEIQDTICSPSEPIKHCEDLDINCKANISSQDSGIVKVETQNSCCFELGQVRNSHSPLELKNLKSEPDSGNYFPPDNQVSQKCVPPQTISDLIEPRDNDEVVQNDAVLQISSVCSLVKGDACYNSQIASIFSTSSLTSTMENDTSLKDCVPSLQCNNQQPVILKTEPEISISVTERNTLLPSPSTLRKAVDNVLKQVPALEMDQSYKIADEMNERHYEEDKKKEKKSMPFPEKKLEQNVADSDVYISDFTSDIQELYQNKYDQLSSSVADGLGGIGKEVTAEESKKQVPTLEMDQSCKTANEMNGRNSEEDKNIKNKSIPFPEKKHEQNVSGNDVHNSDFASYTQELCQSQYDQLSSSVSDSLGGIGKEGTAEENEKQSGSNTEAPVTFLSDQLAELSEEFPYGLGYLKTFSETENNDPVPKLSDPGNNGNLQSSEKFPNSSDAIDQIQIILDSQQSNKMLSEDKQHFSNKSENSESGYLKTDSEHKLTRENVSLKTDKAIDIETGLTSSETPLRRKKQIYCCLQGWLASSFAMEPCACKQVKESASKQKVDLCLQSETTGKDRPKASENCNVDFRLNNELSTSTLDTVAKKVSSEMQSDRTLDKISGDTKAKEDKPYTRDQTTPLLPSLDKLTWPKPEQTNLHLEKELLRHVPSRPLKTEIEAVEIDMRRDHVDARRNSSTAEAQHLSNTEDVIAKNLCRSDSSSKQRTEKQDTKLKTDAGRHRPIINRHKTNGERYKIKWDSSETHIIKGPISNKSLKRQKAMERKLKALAVHHNDAINDSNVSGVGSDFRKHENPQCMPTSHSQEHLIGNKFLLDLRKKFGYKKAEHKEPTSSESTDHHSESTENHSECTIPKIKKINLEKYSYSKDRENAWNCRSFHLENSNTLTPQKQRMRPLKTSKMFSPGKEAMLDANKREKRVERSLSDKMSCFSRRPGKLSISLHREPHKTYLNRVAFKRTTHKTICLTNLEPWHSRSDWQVKSSSLSGWSKDNRKSSSSPQKPEEDKPSIHFKTCPDILFRNPVTEEQILDEENPSEKGRTPVTAIKSKREDWIMDAPAKRKKTEENKPQVAEEIPLETAIKLLERNESFGIPLKETTYETYRKMHLEKSRSLDSSPVN